MSDTIRNDGVQIMPFDYGSVTDQHKEAVKEVINIIKSMPGVSPDMIAAALEHKFEIKELPKFDMMNTEFCQKAAKIGITPQLAGWINENDVLYPVTYFSADVRKFVELTEELKK
tara:strand:+ start:540 stop:884 length:345 start_codon:yes stop_codon:yes gene_type:complete